MTITLPKPIEDYFSGKNTRDLALAISGFAEAATVKDEDRVHRGPAAIRAWMQETSARYDDRAEIRSASPSADGIDVVAEVSGAFPGSPVLLTFRFGLAAGRIASLRIAP